MAIHEREHMQAAEQLLRGMRMSFCHILLQTSPYLIVTATLLIPGMMMTEALLPQSRLSGAARWLGQSASCCHGCDDPRPPS